MSIIDKNQALPVNASEPPHSPTPTVNLQFIARDLNRLLEAGNPTLKELELEDTPQTRGFSFSANDRTIDLGDGEGTHIKIKLFRDGNIRNLLATVYHINTPVSGITFDVDISKGRSGSVVTDEHGQFRIDGLHRHQELRLHCPIPEERRMVAKASLYPSLNGNGLVR